MKKYYVKPRACFESFELSSSIAGTCVSKTNHDVGTCGYTDNTLPGVVFFTLGSVPVCNQTPQDKNFCYQNVNGNLFTS